MLKRIFTLLIMLACFVPAGSYALVAQDPDDQGRVTYRWPYGCVGWKIREVSGQPSSAINFIDDIRMAANEWDSKTDLQFYEADSNNIPNQCEGYTKYIEFSMSALGTGCSTPLSGNDTGYPFKGQRREIYLNCLINMGNPARTQVVTHEIGHALGFGHEHQRQDADLFRTLIEDNIDTFGMPEMQIANGYSVFLSDYDFRSIMHYSFIGWSIAPNRSLDDESTWAMVPLVSDTEKQALVNHFKSTSPSLTNSDINGTNSFYSSDKADIGVSLSEVSYCKGKDFDNGNCGAGQERFQLIFKSEAFNYGPWDAENLEVLIEVNPVVTSFSGFTVLASGNETSCALIESHLIRCLYNNIAPMQSAISELSIVMDKDHNSLFYVSKSQSNIDDFEYNDTGSAKLGGSLGIWLLIPLLGLGLLRRTQARFAK